MLSSKFKIIIIFFLLTAFLIPAAILAVPGEYYRINKFSTVRTKSAYDGAVRFVKNNGSSKDYFLPNKTATEWLYFRNNAPTDLEFIQECNSSTVCGGTCFVSEPPNQTYTVTIYNTVQIGSGPEAQCWMTDNLETRYNYAGTAITQWNYGVGATFTNRFACMGTSNSCPDTELFYQPLAALAAASYLPTGSTSQGVQGICPSGWRIPSEADIEQLATLTGCMTSGGIFNESCLDIDGMDIDKYGYRSGSMGTTYSSGSSAQFLLSNRTYIGNKWVYSLMHVSYANGGGSNDINGFNVRCMKGGATSGGGEERGDPVDF